MEPNQVIALSAVVISVASLYVSWRTVNLPHKHNVLSVRPVPHIAVADYEDRLRIKLVNNGHGPLFINDVAVSDGTTSKQTIIDWMPELPAHLLWTTFTGKLVNRSIPAGGELTLMEFQGDTASQEYCAARDDCRRQLAKLRVSVNYKDIYESEFSAYEKSLSWFGRHV